MSTPWQAPSAAPAAPQTQTPPANAPAPQKPSQDAAAAAAPKTSSKAPPKRVKPFKCEQCYEKTVGWEADDLIRPRTDPATALRLSQLVQLSGAFSFMHTLFLRRERMGPRGPMDTRAYEVATLYKTPRSKLWCHFDTAANIFTQYERDLPFNLKTFLSFDMYLKHSAVGGKAYLQYKTDKFCTRTGLAMQDFKPSMYTLSHLQGITKSLAVGGKVSVKHTEGFPVAAAGSVQYDTGAGVLSVTATSTKKVIASCTRAIAHPNTPNDENVTVAAQLQLDTTNPEASRAALGYRLRFPESNSVVKGTVDSLYRLSCTVENDLELLAVRSFFSSRLDFRTHTYKFGLGFTMGGELPKPRRDNNPLLGAFNRR